jgi:hypothetical protein
MRQMMTMSRLHNLGLCRYVAAAVANIMIDLESKQTWGVLSEE